MCVCARLGTMGSIGIFCVDVHSHSYGYRHLLFNDILCRFEKCVLCRMNITYLPFVSLPFFLLFSFFVLSFGWFTNRGSRCNIIYIIDMIEAQHTMYSFPM